MDVVRVDTPGAAVVVEQDASWPGSEPQRVASVFEVSDARVTRVMRYLTFGVARALAGFDAARVEFEAALRRAPDAALRYRPQGDDYALGGLVVHVIDVLERYTALIDAIRASAWQPLTSPEGATSVEDESLIRDGFPGAQRASVVQRMRTAHTALADAAATTGPDFERKADVMFATAETPLPTSAADVVGWVRDHYDEHTRQVGDLVSAWADASR